MHVRWLCAVHNANAPIHSCPRIPFRNRATATHPATAQPRPHNCIPAHAPAVVRVLAELDAHAAALAGGQHSALRHTGVVCVLLLLWMFCCTIVDVNV